MGVTRGDDRVVARVRRRGEKVDEAGFAPQPPASSEPEDNAPPQMDDDEPNPSGRPSQQPTRDAAPAGGPDRRRSVGAGAEEGSQRPQSQRGALNLTGTAAAARESVHGVGGVSARPAPGHRRRAAATAQRRAAAFKTQTKTQTQTQTYPDVDASRVREGRRTAASRRGLGRDDAADGRGRSLARGASRADWNARERARLGGGACGRHARQGAPTTEASLSRT